MKFEVFGEDAPDLMCEDDLGQTREVGAEQASIDYVQTADAETHTACKVEIQQLRLMNLNTY